MVISVGGGRNEEGSRLSEGIMLSHFDNSVVPSNLVVVFFFLLFTLTSMDYEEKFSNQNRRN